MDPGLHRVLALGAVEHVPVHKGRHRVGHRHVQADRVADQVVFCGELGVVIKEKSRGFCSRY